MIVSFPLALRRGIPRASGRSSLRYASTEPRKSPPQESSPPEPPAPPPGPKPISIKDHPVLGAFASANTKSDPLEPARSKHAEDHVLKPLARPIGLTVRPQPGQNTGIDTRSFQERRDDFFDFDKHIERRKRLAQAVAKPYFRDWSRLQFSSGKIFLAPTRLIRAEKALYFPNLQGITLENTSDAQDTTTVAKNSITLVRIFTGLWAQKQVDTWLEDAQLKKLFEAGAGVLNRIDLNVEQNRMRSSLVRLSMPNLRRSLPTEMHSRYFLIRRGFDEEYKHALGMYNNQVGYVYLLDDECRIRWGGCGDAQEEERVSLRKGIFKLVQELREKHRRPEEGGYLESKQNLARFLARMPSILT